MAQVPASFHTCRPSEAPLRLLRVGGVQMKEYRIRGGSREHGQDLVKVSLVRSFSQGSALFAVSICDCQGPTTWCGGGVLLGLPKIPLLSPAPQKEKTIVSVDQEISFGQVKGLV